MQDDTLNATAELSVERLTFTMSKKTFDFDSGAAEQPVYEMSH